MLATKLLSAMAGGEEKLYAEDVFSAYTRTGTGADVTVTTDIDMTKGYMLWSKGRSGATAHAIYDSARGVTYDLVSNSTAAQTTQTTGLKSVSSTGHTVGSLAKMNTSSATYVDWVFRKAPKFFDVVTYTGNGSYQNVSHSLGVVPGMVFVKKTSDLEDWYGWHRSLSAGQGLALNLTNGSGPFFFNDTNTLPTSSVFRVGDSFAGGTANASGGTYVAYLFAHDTGTDGLIQCGSVTGVTQVNLGWEPQYILAKRTDGADNWFIIDTARNLKATSGSDTPLYANLSSAEDTGFAVATVNANGFLWGRSGTYIYLAIRRPNKPPTVGTQVYNAIARTGTGAAATVTGVGFAPDLVHHVLRASGGSPQHFCDRLRGRIQLNSSSTAAEIDTGATYDLTAWGMDGISVGLDNSNWNKNTYTEINHFFKRAPGVFDVVCYTGTGVAKTEAHGLGVVPELMIVKSRQDSTRKNWVVYAASQGNTKSAWLEATGAFSVTGYTEWSNTSPTASVFTVGTEPAVNQNGYTYVCYLFATLAGISKVGSYTGNGSSQTINCGFTTGARFVLIKATSTTGNWTVIDTTRGLIAGSDPYLLLNSTAAEVTGEDCVDPDNTGFVVNTTTAALNTNGVSYVFLAFS